MIEINIRIININSNNNNTNLTKNFWTTMDDGRQRRAKRSAKYQMRCCGNW